MKSEIRNAKSETNSKFEFRNADLSRISDFDFRISAKRHGFTLVELLVVIGIFLILLAIFVPYLISIRESDRRVRCAENLRQIREALRVYASSNGDTYPRVVYDQANNPDGYTSYTGPDADNPFATGGPVQSNDVTASLWLLVRGSLARPRDFVCPSTGHDFDPVYDAAGNPASPAERGNFRKPEYLSYSYSSPFSSAPGYRMNDTQPSDFAVLADKNPGGADGIPAVSASPFELARGNSVNHGRAGQNVLYADGHVSFKTTPYCGYGGDNIYTALARKPLEPGNSPPATTPGFIGNSIGPAWAADSYLVPTETEGR